MTGREWSHPDSSTSSFIATSNVRVNLDRSFFDRIVLLGGERRGQDVVPSEVGRGKRAPSPKPNTDRVQPTASAATATGAAPAAAGAMAAPAVRAGSTATAQKLSNATKPKIIVRTTTPVAAAALAGRKEPVDGSGCAEEGRSKACAVDNEGGGVIVPTCAGAEGGAAPRGEGEGAVVEEEERRDGSVELRVSN